MNGTFRRTRGVSLIEALVALAVMAFGLLGVVGMQATLRFNSDVSKQRSEAVRMAQEKVEDLRAFNALGGTADHDFSDILSVAAADVAVPTGFANTTFKITTTVIDPPSATDGPQFKTLSVDVRWSDRTNTTSTPNQGVQLTTTVAGVAPELGATLGLRGDRAAPQRPGGRHATIPISAVPVGIFAPGKSRFALPGSSTRQWIFNNATGQIDKVCDAIPTTAAEYTACTDKPGLLLSGYINFSTGTAPDAAAPSGGIPSGHTLGIEVNVAVMTSPPPTSPECSVDATLVPVAYFCLVPTTVLSPKTWSGRSNLKLMDTLTGLIDSIPGTYKVCRYTPYSATSPHAPAGGNAAHPLDYTNVSASLINQNFLVIDAAAACPTDSTAPFLGNTYRHQPDT